MTNYARSFAEFGRRVTAEDFFETTVVAGEMYLTLGPLLEQYDLLVCPTMPLPAVPAAFDPGIDEIAINGKAVHPVWGWCMTYPFNMMSRCPVLAVPSGFAANGIPTGVQLVARTYDDVRVFRAAAALESLQPLYDNKERLPVVPAIEIERAIT